MRGVSAKEDDRLYLASTSRWKILRHTSGRCIFLVVPWHHDARQQDTGMPKQDVCAKAKECSGLVKCVRRIYNQNTTTDRVSGRQINTACSFRLFHGGSASAGGRRFPLPTDVSTISHPGVSGRAGGVEEVRGPAHV